VKFVVHVRLFPTPAQEAALADTLRLCNEAANLVSRIAWETKTFRNYDLRAHTYGELKNMGLSAQPAQHVIKKTRSPLSRWSPPETRSPLSRWSPLARPGRRLRAGRPALAELLLRQQS
jgi:hypothetical protein